MNTEKYYHIGLVKGSGRGNYWRNGHADSTVIVQARRSIDFLSPQTWRYMGERVTTKTQLNANKAALLEAINKQFNTAFTHIIVE